MKAPNHSIIIVLFLFSIQNWLFAQQSYLEVKSFDLVDMNHVWIEGSNAMLITKDGGDTWEYTIMSGSWGKQHVDFVNQETGWVVRDETILKSSNGGNEWHVQEEYGPIPLGPGLPFALDEQTVYVVSDREVLKTSNGGDSWEILQLNMECTSIWFFNKDQGIVAGESGGKCTIKRTTDGGNTWDSETAPGIHELYNLSFINETDGFFILAQEPGLSRPGPLYMTTDRLKSWHEILTNVVSYSAAENGTIYALAVTDSSMKLLKRTENQEDWIEVLTDLSRMRAVKFLDQDHGWVVGDNQILKTTDGGVNWMDQTSDISHLDLLPPQVFVTEVQYDPENIEVISTEDGMIYLVPEFTGRNIENINASVIASIEVRADETGTISYPGLEMGIYWLYAVDETGNISEPAYFTLTFYGTTEPYEVKSFDLVDMNHVWIEGSNAMLVTKDGGDTWEYTIMSGSWGKQHVDFVNQETGWVVRDETILKSSNGGQEWHMQEVFSEIPCGPGLPFAVDEQTVYVVSDREVLKTSNGGDSWEILQLNMECTSAWFFDEDHGIVTGESDNGNCTIKRTTDGGSTWDSETAPGIHELYNLSFINETDGFFILAREPGLSRPGPLYMTTDRLKSWHEILTNVVSYSAAENGTIYALAVTDSSMKLLKRTENQEDWIEVLTDLSRMRAVKFLDEDHGWLVGDNRILKTTDGGVNWMDLTSNIVLNDNTPPTLQVEEVQPNFKTIKAVSSENGMMYLAPEYTARDLLQIQSLAFESIEAQANVACLISYLMYKESAFWLYAADQAGNVSAPFTINVALTNTVNIDANRVSIYPNPVHKMMTVSTGDLGSMVIEIRNSNGQTVLITELTGNSEQLNLSELNSGIYIVRMSTKDGVMERKIIKL